MKRRLFALLLPLLLALPASAALSPIHINVEQSTKAEPNRIASSHSRNKSSTTDQYTQARSLTINLENNSGETFGDLAVKYWFFGHDAKAHDPRPLKQGQRKISLGPRGREVVHSETVSMKYTPEHFETEKRKSNGRTKGRGMVSSQKKVAASGTKLTGYAVQVLNGGTVVAEHYSEDSYKAKLGVATPSLLDSKPGKAGARPHKSKRK